MSENDYIAEYVREHYPAILGMDYCFWKLGKKLINIANNFCEMFKKQSPEELEKAVAEMKEQLNIEENTDCEK